MNILGISAHYHDSAAALIVDGVPVCAVQEERLSRHKGDAAFPLLAIESCLQQAEIEPEALDAVVFYERPMLKFDRILTSALRAFPHSWRAFPKAMKNSLGEKGWMRGIISSHLGVSGRKGLFTEHHQSHAAAAFALDLNYFEFHTTAERSYSSRFVELFGPPRNPYEPIDLDTAEGQRFADCAASVQRVLEDTLVELARALHQETGLPDLCLGRGVALNGVANARVLAESGFERVFVPPAPGDAGCAIGSALYCDRIHFGNPDRDLPDHPF